MIIHNSLITHDGQVLRVEIDVDYDKMLEHLLSIYLPAFSKAVKKGHAKSSKFGRSLTMTARRVKVDELPHQDSPDQTLHIITKDALESDPLK